jgi:hypothetical protein
MSRDVRAEVPRRIPPGVCADASPETEFSGKTLISFHISKGNALPTVDGDPQQITDLLHLAASELKRAQVPEHEMVICAIGLQLVAMCRESGGEGLRIQDDLLGICAESGLGDLQESGGDGGNSLMKEHIREVTEQ